jgi:hypothetical protein
MKKPIEVLKQAEPREREIQDIEKELQRLSTIERKLNWAKSGRSQHPEYLQLSK